MQLDVIAVADAADVGLARATIGCCCWAIVLVDGSHDDCATQMLPMSMPPPPPPSMTLDPLMISSSMTEPALKQHPRRYAADVVDVRSSSVSYFRCLCLCLCRCCCCCCGSCCSCQPIQADDQSRVFSWRAIRDCSPRFWQCPVYRANQ